MASLTRPFVLIAKGFRAFFKSDLRLQRGDRGFEVVLSDQAPPPKRTKKQRKLDASALKEKADLQRVRQSLAALLDELPDNRAAMRHLAFIEHALDKKGLKALNKIPYDVLKRALDQLEALVVNWSDEGLAALRSKMAVALIEREPEASGDAAPVPAGGDGNSSLLDAAPLAVPEPLEGDEAAEAEAALRAAYGTMALPDLEFSAEDDPAVEVQGELASPSGKALAKAARRGN